MGEDMEEITVHEGGNKKKECWEMGRMEGGARLSMVGLVLKVITEAQHS